MPLKRSKFKRFALHISPPFNVGLNVAAPFVVRAEDGGNSPENAGLLTYH
jgi:hypothetical protein